MTENSQIRRGRPPRFTLNEVLDVAERLPHDQLSMTALARELGMVTSALYRYVRDREDLLAKMAARISASLPLPEESLPWDEWLHQTSVGVYKLVVEHPVLADMRTWASVVPAEGRLLTEARDRVLHGAGLTLQDAQDLHTAATNLGFLYATAAIALLPDGVDSTTADDAQLRVALTSGVALLVDGARRRMELNRHEARKVTNDA